MCYHRRREFIQPMVGNRSSWVQIWATGDPEEFICSVSKNTNWSGMIDEMLRQMVGPDAADDFWRVFRITMRRAKI